MEKEPKNYAFDGNELRLISSSTKITQDVPQGTYEFLFDSNTGLHIVKCEDVPTIEFKLYGNTEARVNKSWNAFKRRPHNTGVLLSGELGMGKSVFIKLICAKAKEEGYPVFIVKGAFPGMIQALSAITTECVVVLDEFEKNFREMNAHVDNDVHAQDAFLSLMDGMDSGKKLFIAAINETSELSRYFLNRPGRFLYHYRFAYLEQKEIVDYLEDQLTDKSKVDMLSTALLPHKVNYDSLAAIVCEINGGESIDDTLQDLNLDEADIATYDISLKIGQVMLVENDYSMSMAHKGAGCWLEGKTADGRDARICVRWNISDLRKASTSKYETNLVVHSSKIITRCAYEELDNKGNWKIVNIDDKPMGNLRFSRHYDVGARYNYIGRDGEGTYLGE